MKRSREGSASPLRPSTWKPSRDRSETSTFWAYTIVIENEGRETVQLISRYWHITDANGRVSEVRGAGVVGEQPSIEPGGSYSYTSGCPLEAPSGIMVGTYQMVSASGTGVRY